MGRGFCGEARFRRTSIGARPDWPNWDLNRCPVRRPNHYNLARNLKTDVRFWRFGPFQSHTLVERASTQRIPCRRFAVFPNRFNVLLKTNRISRRRTGSDKQNSTKNPFQVADSGTLPSLATLFICGSLLEPFSVREFIFGGWRLLVLRVDEFEWIEMNLRTNLSEHRSVR